MSGEGKWDAVNEYWLRRIDAHLERGNELFERNERAFERWEAQQDEMREFMREITLRVERGGREQARALRELTQEFRTEMRAQRGALLAILDRLSPGDSGSPA